MKTVFLKNGIEVATLENGILTLIGKTSGSCFDCHCLGLAQEMIGEENYDEEKDEN
jgi:hypothetical protein